ncbi:hypothetical protein [Actinomadura sp. 3N508]|uniref:hypothetical protein n=1 Tax=Actinomadura sp. 3N508 TaxID=3375153 RepID=UPI00379EDE07
MVDCLFDALPDMCAVVFGRCLGDVGEGVVEFDLAFAKLSDGVGEFADAVSAGVFGQGLGFEGPQVAFDAGLELPRVS